MYDIQRGFALTSLATAWGLYIHHYLNFLDRRWPQGGGLRTLAPKVLFNQFLHNPLVYLPLFFTYTGLCARQDAGRGTRPRATRGLEYVV